MIQWKLPCEHYTVFMELVLCGNSENWWMSYPEPVIHHQVLKLQDNPFTQTQLAPSPVWPGLYTSCWQNIKQNNVMATVRAAGGHQLLLGIADDLQPPQSQLLSVVFTCLWHRSKLSRTGPAPSPNLHPQGRAVDQEQAGCCLGLVHNNTITFGKKINRAAVQTDMPKWEDDYYQINFWVKDFGSSG